MFSRGLCFYVVLEGRCGVGELVHGMLTIIAIVTTLCSYTDVKEPSKKPLSRAPPHFVNDAPTTKTLGGAGAGMSLSFSRFVGLRGTGRGMIVSPPRIRRPRVGTSKGEVDIGLLSSLGPGAACAVSFSSTVISGGRNGPLKGFTFAFSAKDTVSAVRMSKALLRTSGLRPIGKVLINVRSGLSSATFAGLPFSEMTHASDHKRFAVHNITPKGCHVFNLVSTSRGFTFDRGDRTLTFGSSLIVPH